MAVRFELRVFGPPQLVDPSGAPVRFRTKKHLALLTYLHFEGRERPLSRDALTDLLWPHAPPEKGRHSLSQGLLAIRERLGIQALTQRKQDVQFLAQLGSDLDRLEEGDAPLPALPEPLRGLENCGGAAFSHWVDATRARILAQARDALRGSLKTARSAGRLPEVHRLAALLYGIDPLCADAVHALAERALLDGDTVAAVRLLKEQVRQAEAELGANPNPEIVHLLRRLERGERPAHPFQASTFPAAMTRREVFVGREAEMSQLEALWDRTRGAGYQTCQVTGAPGIGKSSLIRRFATSLAARAWPALVVPCQEIGQGIPYAAVAELLTALGRDPAAGGTEPLWLAEASRVCPGLRAIYPGIPDPPNAPTDSIRLRVAESVLRMMESVSDQGPMFIGFDDVQHMDPASREVLFLVTRRLDQVPVLILATSRPDTAPESVSGESSRGTLTWAETIVLQPLKPEQAMRLLDDLLGESGAVDHRIRETIVRLAQGNPYFVEMLLSDWKQHEANSLVAAESSGDKTIATWDPPETLRTAFERHYRGLSIESQHLLQLLAVAERAMATPEIAALLGLDAAVVERAVLEILDRGIGRVDGGRVAFKNELHRAYVYYAMGEERRNYFHTRVAGWLSQSTEPNDFQRLLEASHHYICAKMPVEACETALAGAELAVRRGAPGEAERALDVLLRSCPQDQGSRVHLVLANALVAEGRYREAFDALGRWSPASARATDAALAAQLRAESLHRARLADDQTIRDAALSAVSLSERARVDPTLIRALQVWAEVSVESGRLVDADEAGRRARLVATRSRVQECKAMADLTGGYCLLATGLLKEATDAFTRALQGLREVALHVELRRVHNGLGICHTGLGRFDDALRSFAASMTVALKLGDRTAACNTWANMAVACHEGGRFAAAARCFQNAIDLLPPTSRVATPLYGAAARLWMELGDLALAGRYATTAVSAGRESGLWRLLVDALDSVADLCLARGEPENAWPFVEEAIALTEGRSMLLNDPGQFARLRRHYTWATQGYEALRRLEPEHEIMDSPNLSDCLQVRAFDDWVARVEGEQRPENAAAEIVQLGLFGVLSRLIAVGVRVGSIPQLDPSEASAALVARVFELPKGAGIPEIDEMIQQGAAPSRFV